MDTIIQSLSSYLNLAKLTAVTVPGMVVAFALILLLGPIPCSDNSATCPFCPAALKPPAAESSASAGFEMSAQGQTVTVPGTLQVSVPKGKSVSVQLQSTTTNGKTPITGYIWRRGGTQICSSRPSCTADFTLASTESLSLAVIDANGASRAVTGVVVATVSGSNSPAPGSAAQPATSSGVAAGSNQKATQNSVVTSDATWLENGSDTAKGVNRDDLYCRFAQLLPHTPSDKDKENCQPQNGQAPDLPSGVPTDYTKPLLNFKSSCGRMPLYVVPSSRPQPSKSSKTSGGTKSGSDESRFTGETQRSIEDVLTTADECYASLTGLDQQLQADIAVRKNENTVNSTNLGSVASSLVTAQTSGNRLGEADLNARLSAAKDQLNKSQHELQSLTQAESYVVLLIDQVASVRLTAYNQAAPTTAPPAVSDTNPVADVFQTIEQNFLKFLIFSLIVGQIFDPIQRGLVSFFGPRRNVFTALNRLYGQGGDGEFRYGDRRLPPWTDKATYLPQLNSPDSVKKAEEERKAEDKEGLRYGPADFLYRRNMNIYDQNYAIGAGYITQSEFNNIYNDFFTQSQLTSGLILPLIILSVCVGIRLLCCIDPTISSASLIVTILTATWFAIGVGVALAMLGSSIGSRELGRSFLGLLSGSRTSSGRSWLIGSLLVVSLVFSFSVVVHEWSVLNNSILLIMAPCILICPLWVAGLDRLHKYYSELQARIGGNILRQQETSQQKMVDLINQADSLQTLKQSLKTTKDNNEKLIKFLEQYTVGADDGSQPAAATTNPPPTSGNQFVNVTLNVESTSAVAPSAPAGPSGPSSEEPGSSSPEQSEGGSKSGSEGKES